MKKVSRYNTVIIARENSPYNKNIKWSLKAYTPEGKEFCNIGYKTKKEAEGMRVIFETL